MNETPAAVLTELVLASDLVVAAESAKFGLPEVSRGLMAAAGGLIRLPEQLPRKVAMDLILIGEPIDATTAPRWGLVNQVVPDSEMMALMSSGDAIEGPTAFAEQRAPVWKAR